MEEITFFKSENILQQDRNREIQSLKTFYDNYASKLLDIISLLVENEEVREEILQKTFVRIYLEGEKHNPVKTTIFIWMVNVSIEVTSEHFRIQLMEMQKKFCEAYKALKTNNQ